MSLIKLSNTVVEELRNYNYVMTSKVSSYEELRYYEGCCDICRALLRVIDSQIEGLTYLLDDTIDELRDRREILTYAEIRYREGIIDTIRALVEG